MTERKAPTKLPGPDSQPTTLRSALEWSAKRLRSAGLDQPVREAEVLLCSITKHPRSALITHPGQTLTPDAESALVEAVQRRARREPTAYILGEQEFWSLSFRVTPDVLIPRPETECLIEALLKLIPRDAPVRILDVGTGSGAIAVAIASERPRARVVATDISPDALAVAVENAERNDVSALIRFHEGDLLQPVSGMLFDWIVSNPPYIDVDTRSTLMRDVRDYEPALALFSEDDGMAAIRRLVAGAPELLEPGPERVGFTGGLAFEFGSMQSEAVSRCLSASCFSRFEVGRDLAGLPRFAIAR